MELRHDVVFKRDLYGYVEETRVQVWQSSVRQVPVWIVYHPHNEEDHPQAVKDYGIYFLHINRVAEHIERFYHAFQVDAETVILNDLVPEIIDRMRKSKPDPDGLMYRVVYNNPLSELETIAMGSGLYDVDEPRFVNAKAIGVGHWCIYDRAMAYAVATMNASTPYGGYVHDRIKNNPDGGMFLVQATAFNPTGNPKEGDSWVAVDEYPQWNRSTILTLGKDLSAVETVYTTPHY